MSKTYRRNQTFKPKGKDFKIFKKSNKFKKWNEKPHHHNLHSDSDKDNLKDVDDSLE